MGGAEAEEVFWKQVFLKTFRLFVECEAARLNTKQARQTEECLTTASESHKRTTILKFTYSLLNTVLKILQTI